MVEHLLTVQWVIGSIPHGGHSILFLLPYSNSSQSSTTGVTKAVACVILSGMVHIKGPYC